MDDAAPRPADPRPPSASRRRLRLAMDSGRGGAELPDRVPVMCQLAAGHLFLRSGLDPFSIWFTAEGFAEALVAVARRYGFDGILVNLPGREPDISSRILRIERGEEADTIRWANGGSTLLPRDDNARYEPPSGPGGAPGGGIRRPRFEEVDPARLRYVEPWDVTEAKYPFTWGFEEEPRPEADPFPPYHLDPLRAALRRAGGLAVHAEVFSPFSQLLELLGPEAGLLALADDPGKAAACLERLAGGALDLACCLASCGPDALLISSAFAGGGFISRRHYREFVLPYERSLVTGIARRFPSLPIYTHTCGKIADRLDLLLETGTWGIDTLDPPPLGTVDLAEAKRTLAGRAFIKGNIDPVNTLLRGDVEAVREDARRRIAIGAPGGGYILSSACSVAPATPPENLAILGEVAASGS